MALLFTEFKQGISSFLGLSITVAIIKDISSNSDEI